MRILLAHNRYQQVGGEDAVYETERDLLRTHGHEVVCYERHNDELAGRLAGPRAAASAVWSRSSSRALKQLLAEHKPEVAHFTNTFPLISPSAYYACRDAGVAVVQTIQNYRLLCPGGYFFRDGKVCEDCLGKSVAWPGIVHACYQQSHSATAAVAVATAVHHGLGTWKKAVDTFVASTEFSAQKLAEGGLPRDRIAVKPNFLPEPPAAGTGARDYMLFVGRLSEEKGLRNLIAAWQSCADIPLKIAGTGPLEAELREAFADTDHVEVLGFLPRPKIFDLMRSARALIVPSLWYEGFPTTIVQSFACATPVVGSRLGSMAEIIVDQHSGLHFDPQSPGDLAQKTRSLWSDAERAASLGLNARAQFDKLYTGERNHSILMDIYDRAVASSRTT